MAVHEAMIRLRGASPYDEKWLDRPDHDDRITTRLDVGEFLWARTAGAAGPRHAGRPDRGVVVRARRRRAGRGLPVGGLDPGPRRSVGADPGRPISRTTCSPASASRSARRRSVVSHVPVPGRVRQEGRGGRGPRRRRRRGHRAAAAPPPPTGSTPPWPTCRASSRPPATPVRCSTVLRNGRGRRRRQPARIAVPESRVADQHGAARRDQLARAAGRW